MKLTDNEIRDVMRHLEAGRPLPDHYRFLLFDDKREVELVWNGKTSEVCNIVLPFQVIEQVDEPRAEKPEDAKLQADLFSTDSRGRQLKGWTNKLIWGDNKLILSSLKNGPLRDEIEKQGGIKLIYIDPPFDVSADFSMDIEIGDETFTKKPNILEEIAYRDTWGKGADSFIAMMYERLVLLRDLLAEDGSIYVHCDWRVNSMLRLGEGTAAKTPLVVEVDTENDKKDLDALDIEIPVLTPRVYREYKNLVSLDVTKFGNQRIAYLEFSEEQQREIVFKDVTTGEITHTTILDTAGVADYQSAIGYFAQTIMKDLRLVSGYDVLYPKVKSFVQTELFDRPVDLESPNTLRNLSEITATRTILESFKKAINELTIQDKGDARIRDTIKLRQTRPFVAKEQGYIVPKKSIFNRIIGDSPLELEFAGFLENCQDIISYVKNYLAVQFKIDYVNAKGEISNYFPDFIVKESPGKLFVVETKGLEDLDVPLKMRRLKQWCADVNAGQNRVKYDFVFVDEMSFHRFKPKSFSGLVAAFREYKN